MLALLSLVCCASPEVKSPPETENSVFPPLIWLARHQNPDGSWGAADYVKQCVGAPCVGAGDSDFDAGVTALAILAFLGYGYTHLSKDEVPDPTRPGTRLRFGESIKSGLTWLMSKQDPEGCVGGRGPKHMYNHAIAALALSEAYGMTATRAFKGPAQKAIDFLIAAQNPGRAWRYTRQSGDNDTSVTGWAIRALKSAELSELEVPAREAYEGARAWFDQVSDGFRVGYNDKGSGKVFIPGKNESFHHHEAMTATAVLCLMFMARDRRDPALGGVRLLTEDLPRDETGYVDYYYWYAGSVALSLYDGPDGPHWKRWAPAVREALVSTQKKDGCAKGSWTSENDRWGCEGGRVYAVALNALTLTAFYKFRQPVFAPGK